MKEHFSLALLVFILIICIQYICYVLYDKLTKMKRIRMIEEGFQDSQVVSTDKYLENDELFDTFYASVYDQLAQGSVRTQAEIGLLLHEWTS